MTQTQLTQEPNARLVGGLIEQAPWTTASKKPPTPEEQARLERSKNENKDARQAGQFMSYGDKIQIHLILPSVVSMPSSVEAVDLAKEKDPGLNQLKEDCANLAAERVASKTHDNQFVSIFFGGATRVKQLLVTTQLLVKGVSLQDIRDLEITGLHRAQALHRDQRDNAIETEEMSNLIRGGSAKKGRAQTNMFAQIMDKLARVGARMGLAEEYSAENLVAVRLEKCKEILGRFKEEKVQLEYQLEMAGSARAVV